MKVKQKIKYSSLQKLPLSPTTIGRRVEDLVAGFEKEPRLSHLANTFDLFSDVVAIHNL